MPKVRELTPSEQSELEIHRTIYLAENGIEVTMGMVWEGFFTSPCAGLDLDDFANIYIEMEKKRRLQAR